jgi:hypothetical protein
MSNALIAWLSMAAIAAHEKSHDFALANQLSADNESSLERKINACYQWHYQNHSMPELDEVKILISDRVSGTFKRNEFDHDIQAKLKSQDILFVNWGTSGQRAKPAPEREILLGEMKSIDDLIKKNDRDLKTLYEQGQRPSEITIRSPITWDQSPEQLQNEEDIKKIVAHVKTTWHLNDPQIITNETSESDQIEISIRALPDPILLAKDYHYQAIEIYCPKAIPQPAVKPAAVVAPVITIELEPVLVKEAVKEAAVEPMYSSTLSALYRYASDSGQTVKIANFFLGKSTFHSMVDIAITPNGSMYGISQKAVFQINPKTGLLFELASPGLEKIGDVNGLTALDDDRLVISGRGITIYILSTHQFTPLLSAGKYASSGDIIALPDGFLYLAARLNQSTDQLVQVNPKTGECKELGKMGWPNIHGLGYRDQTLFGFSHHGEVVALNPETGAGTILKHQDVRIQWSGATTNPVRWSQ